MSNGALSGIGEEYIKVICDSLDVTAAFICHKSLILLLNFRWKSGRVYGIDLFTEKT